MPGAHGPFKPYDKPFKRCRKPPAQQCLIIVLGFCCVRCLLSKTTGCRGRGAVLGAGQACPSTARLAVFEQPRQLSARAIRQLASSPVSGRRRRVECGGKAVVYTTRPSGLQNCGRRQRTLPAPLGARRMVSRVRRQGPAAARSRTGTLHHTAPGLGAATHPPPFPARLHSSPLKPRWPQHLGLCPQSQPSSSFC